MIHIERVIDDSGSDGFIAYEVPDDFDPATTYATFCAGFKAAHPTKSGNLNARQRVVLAHQWVKHLDKAFKRVEHVTR